MKLYIKYQRQGLLVSEKKIFKVFPNTSLCKTTSSDPIFDHRAIVEQSW